MFAPLSSSIQALDWLQNWHSYPILIRHIQIRQWCTRNVRLTTCWVVRTSWDTWGVDAMATEKDEEKETGALGYESKACDALEQDFQEVSVNCSRLSLTGWRRYATLSCLGSDEPSSTRITQTRTNLATEYGSRYGPKAAIDCNNSKRLRALADCFQ